MILKSLKDWGCYQSQNYKIWKQFTTNGNCLIQAGLLSITKLQNLKAIHNYRNWHYHFRIVVINHKTTKFESNSQHSLVFNAFLFRCLRSQSYKFESNSQHGFFHCLFYFKLFEVTKLRIWKQLTTEGTKRSSKGMLLRSQSYEFESNSQLIGLCRSLGNCCLRSQSYKFESNSQR